MSKEIGKAIKHLRLSRDWTQDELSYKLGGDISRSTLSNYEIGRRTPHLKDLQRIASVFGVGLDYFGVTTQDEAFNLLARAKEVFESTEVPQDVKESLYMEFMKLYLDLKRTD